MFEKKETKMKTKTQIVFLITLLIIVVLIVPSIVVIPFRGDASVLPTTFFQDVISKKERKEKTLSESKKLSVAVYRNASKKVEEVDLEKYVLGVIAAEMPQKFHEEALKAQAVTARTYIYRMLLANNASAPKGADVTDTVSNQVYIDDVGLKKKWGANYTNYRNKFIDAVNETKGQIITYENEPIAVNFFSTSNGYTENSEDYWSAEIPYLRSVESPWDKLSPKYEKKYTFSIEEFTQKLGLSNNVSSSKGVILSRTEGNRIERVRFGSKTFSGREVREKLELASSDFSWNVEGNKISFTTKGYGHGVGMSQYGADGMAKEGSDYEEIISYYFQGVSIDSLDESVVSR